MNQYDHLLIELGEENYVETNESKWPVEIRILFMSVVNAIIFIIIKLMAYYIGETNARDIIRGLTTFTTGNAVQQPAVAGENLTSIPSVSPLPPSEENSSLFGIPINNLVANLGSAFVSNQGNNNNNNNNNNNGKSSSSNFRPVYNE